MSLQNPETEDLVLATNTGKIQGWESVSVRCGVEMFPRNFSIQLIESFPGSFQEGIVSPGQACQVSLGNDLVLTGYIDLYSPTYTANTHEVNIQGRSVGEDIVDSSIVGPPWEYSGSTVSKLLKAAISQFQGINLKYLAADDPVIKIPVSFTPATSVSDVIDELCRMAAVLHYDDPQGNLVINDVGTTMAGSALVEGQNIESAVSRQDWSARFNLIQTIGQDWDALEDATGHIDYLGEQYDSQIRKGRVKHILMPIVRGENFAQKRADWEITRRMGRSKQVQCTLVGWRDGAGTLWTPNTRVSFQSDRLKLNQILLITECNYIRGPNGTQTILNLMDPKGMVPEPYAPPVGAGDQTPSEGPNV